MSQIPKYQQGKVIIKEYKKPWLQIEENIGYDKEDLLKTYKNYIDELITFAKSNDKTIDENSVRADILNILNNVGTGVTTYKDNILSGSYEGLQESIKDKKTSKHILKGIIDRTPITTSEKEFPKEIVKETINNDFIDVDKDNSEEKSEDASTQTKDKNSQGVGVSNDTRTEKQIKDNIWFHPISHSTIVLNPGESLVIPDENSDKRTINSYQRYNKFKYLVNLPNGFQEWRDASGEKVDNLYYSDYEINTPENDAIFASIYNPETKKIENKWLGPESLLNENFNQSLYNTQIDILKKHLTNRFGSSDININDIRYNRGVDKYTKGVELTPSFDLGEGETLIKLSKNNKLQNYKNLEQIQSDLKGDLFYNGRKVNMKYLGKDIYELTDPKDPSWKKEIKQKDEPVYYNISSYDFKNINLSDLENIDLDWNLFLNNPEYNGVQSKLVNQFNETEDGATIGLKNLRILKTNINKERIKKNLPILMLDTKSNKFIYRPLDQKSEINKIINSNGEYYSKENKPLFKQGGYIQYLQSGNIVSTNKPTTELNESQKENYIQPNEGKVTDLSSEDFTWEERAQAASILLDLTGVIASIIPDPTGTATVVNIGSGLASSTINSVLDYNNKDVSANEMLRRMVLNYGTDVLSFVPAVKAAKLTKTIKFGMPLLLSGLSYLALKDPSTKDTALKIKEGAFDQFSMDDYRNMVNALGIITGIFHVSKSHVNNKTKAKVKQSTFDIGENSIKVPTPEGSYYKPRNVNSSNADKEYNKLVNEVFDINDGIISFKEGINHNNINSSLRELAGQKTASSSLEGAFRKEKTLLGQKIISEKVPNKNLLNNLSVDEKRMIEYAVKNGELPKSSIVLNEPTKKIYLEEAEKIKKERAINKNNQPLDVIELKNFTDDALLSYPIKSTNKNQIADEALKRSMDYLGKGDKDLGFKFNELYKKTQNIGFNKAGGLIEKFQLGKIITNKKFNDINDENYIDINKYNDAQGNINLNPSIQEKFKLDLPVDINGKIIFKPSNKINRIGIYSYNPTKFSFQNTVKNQEGINQIENKYNRHLSDQSYGNTDLKWPSIPEDLLNLANVGQIYFNNKAISNKAKEQTVALQDTPYINSAPLIGDMSALNEGQKAFGRLTNLSNKYVTSNQEQNAAIALEYANQGQKYIDQANQINSKTISENIQKNQEIANKNLLSEIQTSNQNKEASVGLSNFKTSIDTNYLAKQSDNLTNLLTYFSTKSINDDILKKQYYSEIQKINNNLNYESGFIPINQELDNTRKKYIFDNNLENVSPEIANQTWLNSLEYAEAYRKALAQKNQNKARTNLLNTKADFEARRQNKLFNFKRGGKTKKNSSNYYDDPFENLNRILEKNTDNYMLWLLSKNRK